MRIQSTIFLLFLISTLSFTTQGQGRIELGASGRWVNGVSEPWWFPETVAQDQINIAQQKWSALDSEKLDAEEKIWAGNYFAGGDTHGSYLRWSANNGFVLMHVDKCAAQVMSFSYGKAILSPGHLWLLPQKTVSASTKHNHEMPSLKFLLVIWSGDRLLVPETEIGDFGDFSPLIKSENQAVGLRD